MTCRNVHCQRHYGCLGGKTHFETVRFVRSRILQLDFRVSPAFPVLNYGPFGFATETAIDDDTCPQWVAALCCFNGLAKPQSSGTLGLPDAYNSHRWLPYGIFPDPRSCRLSRCRTSTSGLGFPELHAIWVILE